ncbi:hypothetical protein XarbCFBP8150_21825, partial [Xanthomonas arboricola]
DRHVVIGQAVAARAYAASAVPVERYGSRPWRHRSAYAARELPYRSTGTALAAYARAATAWPMTTWRS